MECGASSCWPVSARYGTLAKWFGWMPLFQSQSPELIVHQIILAIMVTPIIAGVVRDVHAAVPDSQREAAMALGATK